jgi:hypothetical protein
VVRLISLQLMRSSKARGELNDKPQYAGNYLQDQSCVDYHHAADTAIGTEASGRQYLRFWPILGLASELIR